MHSRTTILLSLGGLAMIATSPAFAIGPVTVPNSSFESPTAPRISPFAFQLIDAWQKPPLPGNPYEFTSGTFYNNDGADADSDPDIDNVDGEQGAFFFSVAGNELFQTLSATYQVGESYHLTIAAEGGGGPMPIGEAAYLNFFYLDGPTRVIIPGFTTTILNDNPSAQLIRHLDDHVLNLSAVQAGDAWAGKSIGLLISAQASNSGGYWDFDKVRLVSVPEPASLGILAMSLLGLGRRRYQK